MLGVSMLGTWQHAMYLTAERCVLQPVVVSA